jgi:hypothetical protein
MAHPPDYHMKLLVGDLVAQIVMLRAENEALHEQLATLQPLESETSAEGSNIRPFAAERVEKID